MKFRDQIKNPLTTKKINGKQFSVNPLSVILSGIIFLGASQVFAQAEETPPEEKEVDVNEILESEPTSAGGKRSSDVQELLVTGIKEQETKTLLKTREEPFSQSIISGEVLNRELGLDYESISKRLANVTFNQNNTRGASLSIRGVGKRAFAEVQDPSVLVIQDGVSFGLTALGNFDFYDIETVEGFRGPVGTLGGKGGSPVRYMSPLKSRHLNPAAN